MSQSENCCCETDPCENGKIGACCYEPDESDSSDCALLTECECRKKRNGVWRGENTSCPDACYQCVCCGYWELDADGLPGDFKGIFKKAHIRNRNPCGTGEITRGYRPVPSSGNCPESCDQPCEQPDDPKGTCCFNCGCVSGVTACGCRKLTAGLGKCTQYGQNFVIGATCESCAICACVNGVLTDLQSRECCAVNYATFIAYEGSCEQARQVFGQDYLTTAASICAKVGLGSGGSGGGGGGFGVPIKPSIPKPTSPPKPCTKPSAYNPTCSFTAWFTIVTEHYEDPCRNYTRDYINLWYPPNFPVGNVCDTLGCCGAPIPNCTDAEAFDVRRTRQEVDCQIGTTFELTDFVKLRCNSEQETYRYQYECPVCPDLTTKKMKTVCNSIQLGRGCCTKDMGKLQFQIPETGLKENGVWISYFPPETVIIDLGPNGLNLPCIGYDSNHPSCKKP